MKLLKKALIALAIVLGILILIGLALPSSVHVERSVTINSTPSAVFAMVNDIRKFNQWSPWAGIDPDTQFTFEGPPTGTGAKMQWSSEHPGVGAGSLEIVGSDPDRKVTFALNFGPQGTATSYYELQSAGDNTVVIWGFDSDFGYDLVGRYFSLFMDTLIGQEYEKGLATLKRLVEQPVPADS